MASVAFMRTKATSPNAPRPITLTMSKSARVKRRARTRSTTGRAYSTKLATCLSRASDECAHSSYSASSASSSVSMLNDEHDINARLCLSSSGLSPPPSSSVSLSVSSLVRAVAGNSPRLSMNLSRRVNLSAGSILALLLLLLLLLFLKDGVARLFACDLACACLGDLTCRRQRRLKQHDKKFQVQSLVLSYRFVARFLG